MERSLRQICALVHVSTGASLEAFGQTVAAERIEPILRQCGIGRGRQRKLPMVLVVWLCVAMNLFATDALDDVLRKLMQGPRFLRPLAPPGPASKGAVTHAGGKAEVICYADI